MQETIRNSRKEQRTNTFTIITLNEEKRIRDALESVKWADEIIVVDFGSADKTIDICKEYTRKIFHNTWPGMNAQKAFAKNLATGDWLLNIDADERVSAGLQAEIQAVLKKTDCRGQRREEKIIEVHRKFVLYLNLYGLI